jgi:phytoene/squalene synthetase
MNHIHLNLSLAPAITKAASKQTYYTIRFLADRGRVADAYRAYAYFRWVDDVLDTELSSPVERSVFVARQKSILEKCYRGATPPDADIHEAMLIELIQNDTEQDSGLQTYLRDMMAVMAFDANRRGRLVSQTELNEYTFWLASAVTEAMHYFIGHGSYSPHDETRYLAVTAAHITHMLRDTFDDLQAGYFNIPREVLEANHIPPQAVTSNAYRAWVRNRIQLARTYFNRGRDYLRRVENPRCRLAGFAYTARFEWLLDTMEREHYCLRAQYNERKSFGTGLRMSLETLSSIFDWRGGELSPQTVPVRRRY